jgi:uncharacterized protein YjbJ (UPF0337 family)
VNWDRLEGQWKQQRGKALHQWGQMMNDELAAIFGQYEELVGRLQEKYGIAKEEAKQQVDLFKMQCAACRLRTVEQMKKSNSKLMEMQKALDKLKKADRKRVKSRSPAKKRTRSKPNKQFTTDRGEHA